MTIKKPRKKKSGSKTLRKIVVVKLSNRTAIKVQRALKRIGIPSSIRNIGNKKVLDLRPSKSVKRIIRKNISLRKALRKK